MNRFNNAIRKQNTSRPPVWFMRQAGRYHSHYQALRKQHSFMDLCKRSDLACEVTMGPIRDFDFDAAILFSDLLFPLEVMGMGLSYPDKPQLDWHLKDFSDLKKLGGGKDKVRQLGFQGEALQLIKKRLPGEKGLIGFVGGPLTLFCYAVEGTHSGELASSHQGLKDRRFMGFVERLLDLLTENMVLQARSGADAVAVFDTCAGDFSPEVYRNEVAPVLKTLISRFKASCPDHPVIYYSKGTGPEHWSSLENVDLDCLGVDWNHDLASVLEQWGQRWAIQGNIDPNWLFLPPSELESRLREVFGKVKALPTQARSGWICGLGHGVLPKTPESNVKLFLKVQKEIFG